MQANTALIRAGIGLGQGLVLYVLLFAEHGLQQQQQRLLFAPLVLLCGLLPPLAMIGLGHLSRLRLLLWLAALAMVLTIIGVHDQWRISGPGLPEHLSSRYADVPNFEAVFYSMVFVFIAWPLILAGESERRWRASYTAYFDAGWKFAVQLMFSGLFIGVFWLVLLLGSGLFSLIKLEFLSKLIAQRWFWLPATTLALSVGLHLTDIRPGIINGIRNLLLSLLSWLLPLLALLTTGFLAALPFTGLQVLWDTRHASGLLLGAAIFIIVLVNAAFQDGSHAGQGSRVLSVSARGACLLLLPLVLIAGYALGLRVNQYGWTPDRVVAAVSVLIAACYAAGYGWAALNRGGWLAALPITNIVAAWLILAMLLALFSPLADPARLAVASQLSRLRSGLVAADQFDFDSLRFDGVRYGHEALQNLKSDARQPAAVRNAAASVLAKKSRAERREVAQQPVLVADAVRVRGGGKLPASFLANNWRNPEYDWRLPACLRDAREKCEALLGDFTGSGTVEVLLGRENANEMTLLQQRGAAWVLAAVFPLRLQCVQMMEALEKGQFKRVAPQVQDLEIAGVRVQPSYGGGRFETPCK